MTKDLATHMSMGEGLDIQRNAREDLTCLFLYNPPVHFKDHRKKAVWDIKV